MTSTTDALIVATVGAFAVFTTVLFAKPISSQLGTTISATDTKQDFGGMKEDRYGITVIHWRAP